MSTVTNPLENPAVAEYLTGKPRLAFTLAEKLAQGATPEAVANLVCALMACDALDPDPDDGDLLSPLPDTEVCEDAFNHMAAVYDIVQAQAKVGFVHSTGVLQ